MVIYWNIDFVTTVRLMDGLFATGIVKRKIDEEGGMAILAWIAS